MKARPAIPAELKRRVLVEAGHRCAIPTCRHIEVEIHHITPWSEGKVHEYQELIALCPNCHVRADRGDIDRTALRHYKANLRFTHDRFSQVEVDVLFDLYSLPDDRVLPWPAQLRVLLRRIFEAGYVLVLPQRNDVAFGGISMTPELLRISPKGRKFINELGVVDLYADHP